MIRALMEQGLEAAIAMAEKGWSEGGIPIGSVLMTEEGEILAEGHNERVQTGDPTLMPRWSVFGMRGVVVTGVISPWSRP